MVKIHTTPYIYREKISPNKKYLKYQVDQCLEKSRLDTEVPVDKQQSFSLQIFLIIIQSLRHTKARLDAAGSS